tara:strand:- start:808 stop:1299 length:492 start_codon:yes stop_codon:yes gene_type:complete
MCSQAAIDILAAVVDQEASSIVRYLEEVAQLRSADGKDAEIQAALEQLYTESCLDMGAIMEILGGHAAVSPNVAWEMDCSRLNFLRPVFVVEAVTNSTREHIEKLGKLSAALGEAGWEEAQQAVERLVERKTTALGRLEGIASRSSLAGSEPPRRNGTSASRW